MATKVEVPATQFTQGGRTGYVLSPTIGEMLRMIPERANPDVIQDANRRLYIPHGKAFGDYVLNTERWVCGALLAGITEDAIEWHPRSRAVSFDADVLAATVKLIDGQHRRYGIDYAIRYVHQEIEMMAARLEIADNAAELRTEIAARESWVEDLLRQVIVVIFYVEHDIVALQQMFADISKVRAPGAETRTLFDRSDPFNVAALQLMETHPLLENRVEIERATLTRSSNGILTLAQLSSILRTLFFGINARGGALNVPPRGIYERGREFFDAIAASNDSARAIMQGSVEPSVLRARGEIGLNATILRIEAAIWRQLRVVDDEPADEVTEFLHELPNEPSETGLWVDAGVMPARLDKATPMGRSQEARSAVTRAKEHYMTHKAEAEEEQQPVNVSRRREGAA